MRQRKIKNVDEKIEALGHLVVWEPSEAKGRWRQIFAAEAGAPLYLEVGCGKGRFITEMAAREPEAFFVGAEGLASVVYRALTKVDEERLENVRFITSYVRNLEDWFSDGELDGIYLNFSDPWPKARNSKRRLTHGERLIQYSRAISEGGFIRFKTDNDELFDFTLGQINEMEGLAKDKGERALRINFLTRDLHSEGSQVESPMTEYEEKFSSLGKKINYVELIKE